METASNVSSEEELLELRNEGKISEEEYEELLETLRKTGRADVGRALREKPAPVRTCGLAVASLVFSLLGPVCCIPAVVCGHLALRKIERDASLRGRGVALAGTIVGYVVLGLSVFLIGPVLLLLYWDRADSHQTSKAMALTESHRMYGAVALTELRSFPLDGTEGLITQSGVGIDEQISSDGNGSLRINAAEPTTVRLFEIGDMDIENARLVYQARLRTANVEGQVYLEMWCSFPGRGEFFSRDLATPLSGTTEWSTEQTPFLLKAGENPDNIKLNLVIEGTGTVWIDDIRLLKAPLE